MVVLVVRFGSRARAGTIDPGAVVFIA